MMPSRLRTAAALAAAAVALAASRGGAQAAPPAAVSKQQPPVRRGTSEADVRFLQGMIGHHAQAITMAALVPSRTQRADMRLLAERIDVSQRDEIKTMRTWLLAHGEQAPDPSEHAGHDSAGMHAMHDSMPGMAMHHDMQHEMMPGMLTPEQLAQLSAATGTEFDRLFLTFMIRHHEGALTMVKTLFASQGAAQDGDVFRLASDVDTDQRAEIVRMRALLAALPAR